MGMPVQETQWTADRARALPDDGKRYEVLDGELFVTPAPARVHQLALSVLFRVLDPYLRSHRIGVLLWSPADIEFSPTRLVQPDLFVERLNHGVPARTWREVRGLVLAIEVLSPTTARADRIRKRRVYMEEEVDEYWIVDLDARAIERWRRGDARPEIVVGEFAWQPRAEVDPLVISLEDYFGAVLD